MSVSGLYGVWSNMKARCLNSDLKDYQNYGARGIKIHDSWIHDFRAFETYVSQELGLRPSKNHSLDRINNDGHYEPGNLRWATFSEQVNNRRDPRSKSGHKFISHTKLGTFNVAIPVGKNQYKYLGSFKSLELAIQVRDVNLKQLGSYE